MAKIISVPHLLLCLVVVSGRYSSASAEGTNYGAIAKEFAVKCLSDTNVFVYNPPADQNPYREMSREDVHKLQRETSRNGSTLFLHLNGLPAKMESRQNFKEHGLHQTWYPDGHPKSIEHYENGKLLNGRYLDRDGLRTVWLNDG